MSMFDTYNNLQDYYIPNNINPCPPKPCPTILEPCVINKPFEDYNALGELIGYWWNYGDTLNLEFNIEGEVVIDNQIQDNYITAEEFMKGKQVTFEFYNFRMEPIFTKTFAGSTQIIVPIDKDLSNKLVKGVYYCTLTIWSDIGLNKTIVSQEDVTFTVK